MLTAKQRSFLTLEQTIGPALFNLGLNAGLAWLVFRKHAPVPLWGDPSIGGDLLATLFLLPFFTCLAVTPLVRRATASGKLEPLGVAPSEHRLLRLMPRNSWARAGLAGLTCLVLLGPPSILVLSALGIESLPLSTAIPFKGVFAALLAALVTPPLSLYALARDEPAR